MERYDSGKGQGAIWLKTRTGDPVFGRLSLPGRKIAGHFPTAEAKGFPMIKDIILDWSGTVVDDLDAVLNTTNDVFREFGRAELSRGIFRAEFVLPLTRFYERFLPEVPLEKIDAVYHRRFQVHREQVNLLPWVREFLEFCRQSGRELYVLSTMHADHFQVQMKNLGL
jgi:phosphoglycolate phosphatase